MEDCNPVGTPLPTKELLFLCGMFILIGPEMRLTEEVLQGIYLKCFLPKLNI